MSDFLKAVVEEAIGRKERCSGRADPPAADSIPSQVNRPNYQKKNRHKRLQVADVAARTTPEPDGPMRREFVENALSPLLKMVMVREKSADESDFHPHPDARGNQTEIRAGMIGRQEGGIRCWFYPELSPRLVDEFGFYHARPVTLGVLTADSSTPGQLFALEEALQSEQVDAETIWSREGGPFEVRLTGKEAGAVRATLDLLCRLIRQEAESGPKIRMSPEPSSMLTRHLEVAAHEAVAVFDSLDKYRSIALLDRCFKKNPEPDFRYRIETSFMVIFGKKDAVSEAVRALRKEAEPYLDGGVNGQP